MRENCCYVHHRAPVIFPRLHASCICNSYRVDRGALGPVPVLVWVESVVDSAVSAG